MAEHAFNVKFVGEVEKHPELFNYNLPQYSRKDIVEMAWNEVGERMNMSAAECKERWKNLRSVYVRNLKRSLPSGSGPKKKKPYYLTEAMEFALPFVKTSFPASSDNVPPTLPEFPLEQDEQESRELSEKFDDEPSYHTVQPPPQPLPPFQMDPLSHSSFPQSLKDSEKKTAAIKSFLDSLVPELEGMTEDQLKQFRRKVFKLIDDITVQPPVSHVSYSSSNSSLHCSPLYVARLPKMEPPASLESSGEGDAHGLTTSFSQFESEEMRMSPV